MLFWRMQSKLKSLQLFMILSPFSPVKWWKLVPPSTWFCQYVTYRPKTNFWNHVRKTKLTSRWTIHAQGKSLRVILIILTSKCYVLYPSSNCRDTNQISIICLYFPTLSNYICLWWQRVLDPISLDLFTEDFKIMIGTCYICDLRLWVFSRIVLLLLLNRNIRLKRAEIEQFCLLRHFSLFFLDV